MTVPGAAGSLLGRVAALGRLDAVLRDVATAGVRVVLCCGPAGAGKTALLGRFADEARERGAAVVWPAAFGGPGAPPSWVWQQVTRPHRPADREPIDRITLADRVAGRLRSAGADRPAVLVLDDLDRADMSSLATLPLVLRALDQSHVLVCAAFTDDSSPTSEWAAARRALDATAAEDLPLPGLAAEDIRRLLAATGLGPADAELVDRVLAVTAGNPLFVRELARQLTVDPSSLPRTLGDLVAERVDRLAPPVRRVLRAASVLGERFRLAEVARTLHLEPADALDAVDAAVRGGLLMTVSDAEAAFRHSVFGSIIASGMLASERAELHRQVAEALDPAGHPPGVGLGMLAYHWSAAAAGGASAEACAWALRAAEEAMWVQAYEEADRLYQVALDHGAGLSALDRARLQVARAAAAVRAGRLVAAHEDCAAALDVARQHDAGDLLADAALALEPIGDPAWDGDVHGWCTEALTRGDHDPATSVRLWARLSQAAAYLIRDEEADRASSEALQRAAGLDDTEARVDALTARQLARSGPDDVDELAGLADQMLALAAATGRADLELRGRLWRIDTHWYGGRLSAIAGETAGLQRCAERGGPYARWHLLSTRGLLAVARAEFDHAERLLREALDWLARLDHPAVHGASVSFGLLLGHHRGHAADLGEPSTWDFGTDIRWDLFSRLARAFVLVDGGQLDEAAVLYSRCGYPAGWRIPAAGRLVALAVTSRVATALGALDHVAELHTALAPYRGRFVAAGRGGTNFLGPVDLALGRCSAALGEPETAWTELEAAGAISRAIGAPGFAVESDTELAAVLAGAGAAAEAARVARRALPLARSLGMTPWADRLATLAATKVPVDPLTAREREVASLVAAGLSNRAIADRLVISERTAENHVQHILGKLGFANRAQIAAWTSRRSPG